MSSATVGTSDFESPMTTTDYDLCIYDASGFAMMSQALGGAMCGTRPCWRALGPVGFKYKNKQGAPANLASLLLRAGGPQQARIQANPPQRGAGAYVPSLPLDMPVRAQLQQDSSATCWEATYSNALVNSDKAFKAKSD